MNEYKIGLNIDGVLLDTIGAYLTIFNRENNTKFTRYDITDFYFHKTLGVTKKVMLSYFKKIEFSKVMLNDVNIPSMTKEWKSRGYIVDLITASSPKTIESKCKRLRELGVMFDDVYMVEVEGGDKGSFATKYDIIVDDSLVQLESILLNNGNPICFDQPNNVDWDGARVYNFKEIDKIIRDGY